MNQKEVDSYCNIFSVIKRSLDLRKVIIDFLDYNFIGLFQCLMGMNSIDDVLVLKNTKTLIGRIVYIDGTLYDVAVNEIDRTFILKTINKKRQLSKVFNINRQLLRNLVESYSKLETIDTDLQEKIDQPNILSLYLGHTLTAYILVNEEMEKLIVKKRSLEVIDNL